MDIRVRFFGFTAERTGCAECVVSVAEPGTVQTVSTEVLNRFPQLEPHRSAIRWARNTDYADARTPVRDGDVLSMIPPVAGG